MIGAGSMGKAQISGWTRSSSSIVAVLRDVAKYQYLEGSLGIEVTEDREVLSACEVVVIAIKPQIIKEILADFAPFIAPGAIVISVAVGAFSYKHLTLPTIHSALIWVGVVTLKKTT